MLLSSPLLPFPAPAQSVSFPQHSSAIPTRQQLCHTSSLRLTCQHRPSDLRKPPQASRINGPLSLSLPQNGSTESSAHPPDPTPPSAPPPAPLMLHTVPEEDLYGNGAGRVLTINRSGAVAGTDTGTDTGTDSGPEEGEVQIDCRNVWKSFEGKEVLRGASFKIRSGEAVGIIGPSGTGKSTVLRIMAGLLAPDAGEVFVCGHRRKGLASDEQHNRLRIGLVFQSAALFDSLTVRENVGFMLYEHSNLSDVEIRRRVKASLAAVGLRGVEELVPSELSGGMKKRVALARAIISDGNVRKERQMVMYDEPTAGLDPIASTVVEDLIRSLHVRYLDNGDRVGEISSYVVVTHQHSTIRRAVDRWRQCMVHS